MKRLLAFLSFASLLLATPSMGETVDFDEVEYIAEEGLDYSYTLAAACTNEGATWDVVIGCSASFDSYTVGFYTCKNGVVTLLRTKTYRGACP